MSFRKSATDDKIRLIQWLHIPH